ncbi:MAG: M14 family zinc carboxypeptidase, partial [Thermoleophilaceae bacterium]
KSFQGRDIEGIEVTDDVGANDDGKPTFWLMGVHHAREWPSAEIPVEFGYYLVNNFGTDPRVTALLKKVRIVITPVINPDGYITSRESTDPADLSGDPGAAPSLAESVAPPGGSLAYRRKNCDGASPSPATPCNLQWGVDPNRNYGQNWGGPGAGTDPNDQDYRGTGMWSEPETQAVHAFEQSHDVTTLITMHNFASLVLRPPGVHNAGQAPDEDALKKLGDRMGDDTGYTSEYGYQLYDTSGTTEDWSYAAQGTFGYTIEMGPSADQKGNFHISYDRAVVNQWTGSESEKGKGKGLRDALLAAGEAAADQQQFSTLTGTAPAGEVLRLHKDFTTFSSDICTLEDTDVDCTAQGALLPKQSQPDHLDYTTVVPPSGKFSWIVTPSTRPFELKAGRTEQWTLTCEDPGTRKVEETRKITVDRGQTLELDLPCGGVQAAKVTPAAGARGCVDKRKLKLQVHSAKRDRPRKIQAFVNGKLVTVLRGRFARSGKVNLENLRSNTGTFDVSVVAFFKHGVRRVSTRTYKACTKSKPKIKKKKPRKHHR